MRISQFTTLSKPTGTDKISIGTFGYLNARNRQRAFNIVMREFRKSGLSQADLAKRLGKRPEVVSRLLARPGNWELDTYSELLFAICGAVPKYETAFPFEEAEATPRPRFRSSANSTLDITRDIAEPARFKILPEKTANEESSLPEAA